jgi:hypothetical protein
MMAKDLFVAWRAGGPTTGRWGPVGKLERADGGYRFRYTRGAKTLEGFEPFSEMPDLTRVYESDSLFPLFANRLLSPSRPEFEAYLTWSGFDPAAPPDPISLLGITEGLRATDAVELFPCPDRDPDGRYSGKFFVHGVRHMPEAARERVDRLKPGESLAYMFDVSNRFDPDAVALRTCDTAGQFMVGYVPRYLAREVHALHSQCPELVSITVARVNPSAPAQQRLLCQMIACWPDGFCPCGGEAFKPVVSARQAVAG